MKIYEYGEDMKMGASAGKEGKGKVREHREECKQRETVIGHSSKITTGFHRNAPVSSYT
jgi:hypothetical protein